MVKQVLKYKQAYTLQRPVSKQYVRIRKYVAGIYAQWQADLANMQAIASTNKSARYLLTVINVFCTYAYVAPVKSINAPAVKRSVKL